LRGVHPLRIAVLLLCMALWLPAPVSAAEPSPGTAAGEPPLRKTGPDTYQIGTLQLDAAARTIRCPGHVNMDKGGPIELMACLTRGKTHESVLTLDVVPMHLQIALLLLGLTPGRNPAVHYDPDSPAAHRPPGDTVVVSVEWPVPPAEGEKPKLQTVRAESLLLNVQTEKPLAEAKWVFLGSRLTDGRFGADVDGTLITTYHDPLSILELADETANDDIYYNVNAAVCPPVGTAVTLIIHAPLPEPAPGETPKDKPAGTAPPAPEKETHDVPVDRDGPA
jgi:hypothetical protein